MKDYKRILIIKMSSLGDVLHALPTLNALRANCPHAKIVWAVHEKFSAVLPGKPYIDEIIYIDKKRLKSPAYWLELRHQLHAYHFDLSLDLQGLAKSAIVAFLSGARERYGYWEMREGSFLVSKGLAGPHKQDHVIERYLDTVRVLGGRVDSISFPLPRMDVEVDEIKKRFQRDGLQGPYVAIAPGARWAVKEWPVESWSQLAEKLTDAGMNVLLLGSGDDVLKGRAIAAQVNSPHVFDYTGQTNLRQLMAAISLASVYMSADTGPLHLANALQVELIALFGPTCPDRTGPYGGPDCSYIHMIISPTSRATTAQPLIDDPDCMKQITVEQVWRVYTQIMEKVGL